MPTKITAHEPTFPEIIATHVILLSVTKGLAWLTKEEHKCPIIPVNNNHVFIIDYFKALTNASNSYVRNLKLIQSFEPQNKDVPLLLTQALSLQKKFADKLEEVEKLSHKQRLAYQLTQEHNFNEQDLKILALLKARGYKDVPQDIKWQSKKDEYVEVNPGIFVHKDIIAPKT